MKNDSVSSGTLFALLYVSLFVGAIIGNWLPFSRVIEIALLFLIVSAVLTWASSKRPKSISTVSELNTAFSTPKAQQELAEAVTDHRRKGGAG
jgi:hypothetical protein